MKAILSGRSEQQVFEELAELCSSPGYIHALAYFSYRDNFIRYDTKLTTKDMAESYAPSRTIRTEFATLLGLMIKHPIDFDLPSPSQVQSLIDQTEKLLLELHCCLNAPMFESIRQAIEARETDENIKLNDPFMQGDVLREPIFYGGDSAYDFQYRDLARERYAKDDNWLIKNKGFKIDQACTIATALKRLQSQKFSDTIEKMRKLDMTQWTMLPMFTFSIDEISIESGIDKLITAAVLDALSIPTSPSNKNFTSLGEFNLANALPILRTTDGAYISLTSYGIVEALYDSPFYWMAADQSYKDTAFKHRGEFTENFVANKMETVFGHDYIYRNVNIYDGSKLVGEIDVLVQFADRVIVFQCKSKKSTLEARKGNDLRLREDFKKAVQDSYDQGLLCGKSIVNSNLRFIGGNRDEIILPTVREIYLICVVSDHYPALAIQARQFLKFESNEVINPPLICDIFLIDVLVEMLTSPLRLLSYINRRVKYGDRINSSNELTILAYHLKQNLWIEEETDMLMLADDVSIDLDTAMTIRRVGLAGQSTPEGILTKLEGTFVGRLLRAIENSPEPVLVDLGFLLLKLSSDALDDINRGIKEITRRTRLDGQCHDITVCFTDIGTGITIHCNLLPYASAADKLARHCRLRKYSQRADSWFGLAIWADGGLPKFGINLRFPWKQDDVMDEKTKGLPIASNLPRNGAIFKQRKTGRNEPCPCGSGKKFKKCCLGNS